MKLIISVFLIMCVHGQTYAQSQWPLQTWVEKYGEVPFKHLGRNIVKIPKNPNLPYRVGVEEFDKTSFYTFSSSSDTSVKCILPVESIITGDLNNDGYLDMVGRRNFYWEVGDTSYSWDSIYVYWGTAVGYDSINVFKIPGRENHLRVYPLSIGDVNNDGFNDLVLSSYAGYYTPWGGEVYIYFGNTLKNTPDRTIIYDSTKYSNFGISCNIADLNNDGFYDLIVRGNVQNISEKYLYNQIYWGANNNSDFLNKTEMRVRFDGVSYTTCFDANGDSIPDLLWKISDSSRSVYIYFGGADFDTSKPSVRLADPGSGLGGPIVNAGDMNGDGYDDIAVGAPSAGMINGFVFIYSGGPNIDGNYDAAVGVGLASWFGWALASVGDVNGDSLADIIVGAHEYPSHNDPFDQRAYGYWGIFLGSKNIPITSVQVAKKEQLPYSLELSQNYPNPFNPKTTIAYSLQKPSTIRVEIFNALGQTLQLLFSGEQEKGLHRLQFDGEKFSSGTYFYRVTAKPKDGSNEITLTKSMILIK